MFVSFEGIEGCGKSTLLSAVERAARASGREPVVTREPGGTPAGDAIRDVFLTCASPMNAMTETLLVNASRSQLVADVIAPALRRDALVLCDRYVHSTLAYQGYGRGLPLDLVRSICDAATGGLMPDLTLVIDVSYETSRQRLTARGDSRDRLEREPGEFHRRVREGFLELAKHDERVIAIDGERAPEEVLDAALAALSAAFA